MPCLAAVTKPIRFCLQSGDDTLRTIHLPWNTVHPSLPAFTTRIPLQLRCTAQSTQNAIVDRASVNNQKCRKYGTKYMNIRGRRKASRCITMSSRGCVHVEQTSLLQRCAGGLRNKLMFEKKNILPMMPAGFVRHRSVLVRTFLYLYGVGFYRVLPGSIFVHLPISNVLYHGLCCPVPARSQRGERNVVHMSPL